MSGIIAPTSQKKEIDTDAGLTNGQVYSTIYINFTGKDPCGMVLARSHSWLAELVGTGSQNFNRQLTEN